MSGVGHPMRRKEQRWLKSLDWMLEQDRSQHGGIDTGGAG